MRVSIIGYDLPGSVFCRPDGSLMNNVHVGVQQRREPAGLVRADRIEARWDADVEVVGHDEQIDFRGPVVQGKRGDRFIYLTWGELHVNNEFEMFRRAKLMLGEIDPDILGEARIAGYIVARVNLTDDHGGPRCARVRFPAIEWSVPSA